MWAWRPSCLNPNRRATNRLKTQGRDVSSGKCSPAKFLKAGPACMQEGPGSGSREVFTCSASKTFQVKAQSSGCTVPAVPGIEFEPAVPRDLCSTKAIAGTDSSSKALHNVADKCESALSTTCHCMMPLLRPNEKANAILMAAGIKTVHAMIEPTLNLLLNSSTTGRS